jgi:DNA-binding response OmpR family regulator
MVIDDDQSLHEAVADYFGPYGFTVHSLLDGREILKNLARAAPKLIIIDVMLPDGADGFQILRLIRDESLVPVIMLSARGEEVDRVLGLELGADDYMSKPFSLRELLARVRALLRRASDERPNGKKAVQPPPAVKAGPFTLQPAMRRIFLQDRFVEISSTEASILRVLMERPQEVLARESLIRAALGHNHYIADRGVDVHVSRLRAALKKLAPNLSPIQTAWGTGYYWNDYE